MRRFALLFALAMLPAGGCSMIGSSFVFRDFAIFQDAAIANRNQNEAYKAWKRARWDYWRQGVPHYLLEHIGRGFQQGFIDAAAGGGQELPYFPPRHYWGPAYQNPKGQEQIAAWFRGYSDGAMAGEQSGLSRYLTLPTSSAVPMTPEGSTTPPPAAGQPSPPPNEYLPPEMLRDIEDMPPVPSIPSVPVIPVPPVPPELPPTTEPLPKPISGKQAAAPAANDSDARAGLETPPVVKQSTSAKQPAVLSAQSLGNVKSAAAAPDSANR